ncbi:hypothetical protein GOV14_06115 [Candidatus Pacearchaeota archaeon]|nr:hypothetical protein [Candidatus Pacearchaeota archaeon]
MINWIIVAVFLIGILFFMRMNHLKHRYTIIFLILLALFLYATISVVNSRNEFDLTTTKGSLNAVKVYLGWLGHGFQNLKALTGNAIKMDWTNTNGTFFNKTDINPQVK